METDVISLITGRAWYQAANEADIPSPALLLIRERIDENLRQMLEIAGGPGRLRPHVKTHKLPELIEAQLRLGITKFKCATIAEAEMTTKAGAQDVLLAFPTLGPNARRLVELQAHYPAVRFSVIVDSEEGILDIANAARAKEIAIPVLLDLDCGMHRTGVPADSSETLSLYELLTTTPGIIPAGLHAYDGHIHDSNIEERTAICNAAFTPVEALRSQLVARGFPVPTLIAGGTPTFAIHAAHPDRELSPGTCVLWDFGYGDKLPDLPFEPAAVLVTRVVSKPGRNRLCLDLGHKAVASENPHPRVRFLELPDAVAVVHSEEHLVVETDLADQFPVGSILHGIPRHVCPTVALHDEVWPVRDGIAGPTWRVTARARRLSV